MGRLLLVVPRSHLSRQGHTVKCDEWTLAGKFSEESFQGKSTLGYKSENCGMLAFFALRSDSPCLYILIFLLYGRDVNCP